MNSLGLRLVLAPALIAAASLAGRRWGPTISGWLIGLPLTSGPIAFLLAVSYGASFAAASARGTLAGTISLTVYAVVYAWVARRYSWPVSVVASSAAFGVVTLGLQYLTLPLPLLLVCITLTLLIGIRLMPASAPAAEALEASAPPAWDLPARMLVAAFFVLLLTGAAAKLGPQLTGLVSPFPIYATILAVFAHQRQGARAAADVLRGLLVGMVAFVGFFLVVSVLLEPVGIGWAFTLAVVVALLAHGGALWALRRRASHAIISQ